MFIAAVLAAGWLSFAPVLTPRQEVAVAAANGKVYLIGGIGDAGVILDSVEEYDPHAGAWRFVAPLPRPVHHAAAATIGISIYVIGGYETLAFDPVSFVYRFDTQLDQWTEVASLPLPRGALAAVAIGGKIYAAGGVPRGRDLTVYDPNTNAWTTLPSMPTPREHLAAAAANGILFVAGGRFSFGNTNAFECYEPGPQRWTALPPLPTARSGIAAAVLAGRMYVFGGEGNSASLTGIFPQTESFDLATFTWRSEPLMRTPRHGIGAATIGKLIFIPAGATVQGFGRRARTTRFSRRRCEGDQFAIDKQRESDLQCANPKTNRPVGNY
ncbi:MAG TPA: kelch repeat-containing protein [Thermoanaerobaculia bacterium]|nr:kelch repeat-containing protein [Thermoanaerobaculia bacterium]